MPSSVKASASMRARVCGISREQAWAESTTVTALPMRRKNWANSQPTGPAPITTRLSGISRPAVASRFVQ